MDYEKAKAIATSYKPDLVVDPQSTVLKDMIVVRRKEGVGMPFSIHLPSPPAGSMLSAEEIEAQELVSFKQSLDEADRLLPAVAD